MPDRLSEKDDEIRALLGEGQAALWLGESLILALIEANLLGYGYGPRSDRYRHRREKGQG